MPHNRPTLAIIGAGRVGRALGRRLRQRGWRIGAVVTRSRKTATAAARAIGAGRPQARLDACALAADVVLITTPDRTIANVAQELARIQRQGRFVGRGFNRDIQALRAGRLQPLAGRARQGRSEEVRQGRWTTVILHTNGALNRSVLAPLEKLGAATGSLHPLQTFTRRNAPNLDGTICAIEGMPRALRAARRIARDLGCIPVVIAPRSKPAYHAAAALAAGHTLAVIEAATRILIAVGFKRREAVRALLPLTRETLANFERLGPNAAWTGPLARRDFATAKKHAAALRRFPREYRQAYATLSRLAVLVLRKGNRFTRMR
jgi:predicted short-subunit dehydrogenase-like oxidoreductase (DUF2520 family)